MKSYSAAQSNTYDAAAALIEEGEEEEQEAEE